LMTSNGPREQSVSRCDPLDSISATLQAIENGGFRGFFQSRY
jgi:hypothetical protein